MIILGYIASGLYPCPTFTYCVLDTRPISFNEKPTDPLSVVKDIFSEKVSTNNVINPKNGIFSIFSGNAAIITNSMPIFAKWWNSERFAL